MAAGITPIAHGNDLAGSICYPACCTDIAGLRPSFGRVPAFNPSVPAERPLSMQWMSVRGPLARRVAALRLALAVMARADDHDPGWVPAPLTWPRAESPIRVALSADPMGTGVHPAVVAALRRAADALLDAGHIVEPADPPDMAGVVADWHVLQHAEAHALMLEAVHAHGDEGIGQCMLWRMERPARTSERDYMTAVARRATWLRRWATFLSRYPVRLCPVSLSPPFLHGADVASEEAFHEIVRTQAPSFAIPLLGLPAVSVPNSVANGLPTGVQRVASRFREDLVLDAAEAIEPRWPMATPVDPVQAAMTD